MSGGKFDYIQYRFLDVAEEIEDLIKRHDTDEYEKDGYSKYNNETIDIFKRTVLLLKVANVCVQRIDWLVSGDDGEETFHERLIKELKEIQENE